MDLENIKSYLENNNWNAYSDDLFLWLLEYMLKHKRDIGKKYTVKEITEMLDSINTIKNPKSYRTARMTMFSNVKGRDYFIFNNKDKQDKLTNIVRKEELGFNWKDYLDEKIYINPQYKMRAIAGSNENKFKEMLGKYELRNLLKGKKTFDNKESKDDKVSISVDESIENEDNLILIEIDSGNMAKLIVGQYTLLNILYEESETKDVIFIVIHYYKDYNTKRTIKNLKLVEKLFKKAINFKVYTIEEFEEICKNNKNKADNFIKTITEFNDEEAKIYGKIQN